MSDFKIRGSDVTVKIFKIKILLCPEALLWSNETVKPFFDALTYCRRYVLRSKAKGDDKRRAGETKSRKSQKTARNNLKGTFMFYMHKNRGERASSKHKYQHAIIFSPRSKMDGDTVTTGVKGSPFDQKELCRWSKK